MKKFISNVYRFICRTADDNLGLYAAQASFFLIFSVTPFIMLLFTLAKYFIPISSDDILTSIYNYVPSELAEFLATLVKDAFDTSIGLISVSAISTLWLASKGIMALHLGLNNIYKPEKNDNYIYVRVASIIYTVVFIIALVLTIIVFGFGQHILEGLPINPLISIINKIFEFRVFLFVVLLTVIFALFYKFLPRNESFKHQLPGAALAALGWILFSYIYSIYIRYFSGYSYVYGSLTAIIFLMLWLYVCMNILLYGAEFNKLRSEKFFE